MEHECTQKQRKSCILCYNKSMVEETGRTTDDKPILKYSIDFEDDTCPDESVCSIKDGESRNLKLMINNP